ncbi:type I restriction-modification system endonuclease [Azotosporobacter soli]|uniref:type I restriction-modification system endonuclease n=1 Tax=Azotosporobacter soli TaxID=3055040 RepID=UPI0031FF17AA
MSKGNFEFLKEQWPILAQLGALAEKNIKEDSNTTLIKLGMFAETLVKYMFAYDNLEEPSDGRLASRIMILKRNDLITGDICDVFYALRTKRNVAAHEVYTSETDARRLTKLAYKLAVWFMQTYGDWKFEPQAYVEPTLQSAADKIAQLENEKNELTKAYEDENKKLKETLDLLKVQATAETSKQRKEKSKYAAKFFHLDETETRKIIDEKLRVAGWEVDTDTLRYSNGTRPVKNKNMAIAEWPTDSRKGNHGRADYALFVGLKLVGIVEAKRAIRDVAADLGQSKDYARFIKKEHLQYVCGKWDDGYVPFLFSTNGRDYLKQLETKSGIWFLDARQVTNHAKALQGWYTPEGLAKLLEFDEQEANARLKREDTDYLSSKTGLALREYQIKAIEAIEAAIEDGRRSVLIAMATGTGKTRTIVGILYRLLKAKRFKRILFLVDRKALGNQAEDTFKEVVIEGLEKFYDIYDIKGIEDIKPEPETKIHISTVQGMVRRVLCSEELADAPKVDDYDCIVIDEAHRGYILDKEMGEVELEVRDQSDYVSKYTQVIEYFDALKIALTATPALHTKALFGEPVYKYSYREAVIDGYLVDHEPPHQLTTQLKDDGIKFAKGESVDTYDMASGTVVTIDDLPDELNFDIESFNKRVINENFNRVVLAEIAQDIDPEGDAKTLIFAATDAHADMIVALLKEIYGDMGLDVCDDAIQKITGSLKDPLLAIKQFKNEQYPNIAVTVDLLSTGIDVPKICNLVFLRRVKSRILYEQMLGRATRLCGEIGKTHFTIYDAVGLYEVLEDASNMKPVVKNVSVDFATLVDELTSYSTPEQKQAALEQIIAKLQRKKRQLDDAQLAQFRHLAGGQTPDELIQHIKLGSLDSVIRELGERVQLIDFLDRKAGGSNGIVISTHADVLTGHGRGYGVRETRPEDYIESFSRYIKENLNKIPALEIVCTRPKELTRQALKELKIELDLQGYNEMNLNTAWRSLKNEDIAADIISFIRQQALGRALLNHEQRVKNAVGKVKQLRPWTKIQLGWLERIEKQLLLESVIDKHIFNAGAFKSQGGFAKIDKIFAGQLDQVIDEINEHLYEVG